MSASNRAYRLAIFGNKLKKPGLRLIYLSFMNQAYRYRSYVYEYKILATVRSRMAKTYIQYIDLYERRANELEAYAKGLVD